MPDEAELPLRALEAKAGTPRLMTGIGWATDAVACVGQLPASGALLTPESRPDPDEPLDPEPLDEPPLEEELLAVPLDEPLPPLLDEEPPEEEPLDDEPPDEEPLDEPRLGPPSTTGAVASSAGWFDVSVAASLVASPASLPAAPASSPLELESVLHPNTKKQATTAARGFNEPPECLGPSPRTDLTEPVKPFAVLLESRRTQPCPLEGD